MPRRILAWISAYMAAEDPLVGAANLIALVLAGNQPFYPLYLVAVVGPRAWPALIAIVSTPFFFAVPAVARRFPLGGRVFLILVSVVNTIMYIKLIGEPSGLELFLAACAVLAALIFRRSERWIMLACVALPVAIFVLFRGRFGDPVIAFQPADYSSMVTMNAISVGTLTGFFGIIFANLLAAAETPKPGR